MIDRKSIGRVKLLAILMSLLASILLMGLKVGAAATSTTCDPDPTDPLKCYCEAIQSSLSSGTPKDPKDKSGTTTSQNICDLNNADKSKSSDQGLLAKNGIIKKVFNLLSWLTGLLAGIYLMVGGTKIITSSGNSDSVTSGRKMIIYALIGIAVVISSNLIINFVIGLANNASK